MCDHPDYARLVDIPSNKYELNLIVSLPAPEKPKGKPEENSLEQSQKKNLKSRKRNKKHPKSDNDKGEKKRKKKRKTSSTRETTKGKPEENSLNNLKRRT